MKLIKTSSGKDQIKMSKKEWMAIGKKAGWTKKAQYRSRRDPELERNQTEEMAKEDAIKIIHSITRVLDDHKATEWDLRNYQEALEIYLDQTGGSAERIEFLRTKPTDLTNEEHEEYARFYGWVDQNYVTIVKEKLLEDEGFMVGARDRLYEQRDPYGHRGLSPKEFH